MDDAHKLRLESFKKSLDKRGEEKIKPTEPQQATAQPKKQKVLTLEGRKKIVRYNQKFVSVTAEKEM